jgi:hypothetical protein
MAEKENIASIADASKPNAGRIYDFMLGGNHNFEVDRLAAQEMLKENPNFPKGLKLIRWFLGEAVRRLIAEGFTQFIDFASGLPTVDHIHQIAPKGTRVVYSDIDPVTVAYGQEIIKDNPDSRYVLCNVVTPEKLLEDPEIKKFIDKGRKTAIGLNGICWFISDEELSHSLRVLYDWADKGTVLYISDVDAQPTKQTELAKKIGDRYEKIKAAYFSRSHETFKALSSPWKIRETGFKLLEDWIDLKAGISEDNMKTLGVRTVGGFLEK